MSAIFGMIDLTGGTVATHALAGMEEAYRKYKIDRMESLTRDNVAMGCGIQYFYKEAEGEVLPFYDENEKIMYTADVVLDNREELIRELGLGTADETGTPGTAALNASIPDGLILYKSYLKWGKECFGHLRGAYSAVIYDARLGEIFLAVDQFSQRCLFYHVRDGVLYFSTLLFPLIRKTGLEFEENERWLVDCVTLRSPVMITEPRETALTDVFKVVSGTYVGIELANPQSMQEIRYYNPNATIATDKNISPKQSEELIREAMRDTISSMLRDGVDYACQLSAGLDSSTVACIAATMLGKKGKVLRSFTSVPLKEANLPKKGYLMYDESEGVKHICENYPNIIPTFLDTPDRHYLNEIDHILNVWEMPCKSEQNAIWDDEIGKRVAADGCRVLLTGATGNCTLSAGQFGDIIYDNFKHLRFCKAYKMLGAIKHIGASRKVTLRNMWKKWVDYYAWYFDSERRDCYHYTVTRPEIGEKYKLKKRFNKTLLHFFPFANRKEYRRKMYMNEANAQIGELDTKFSLEHGVLSRDPMRSVAVVNLCFRLPMECYVNSDYDRRLVRVGMEGIVPEKIRHDMMHRGRQSGDNEYRISLTWDKVLPEMKKYLYGEKALRYLSKDKLDTCFEQLMSNDVEKHVMEARMLVDAYTFAKYLETLNS